MDTTKKSRSPKNTVSKKRTKKTAAKNKMSAKTTVATESKAPETSVESQVPEPLVEVEKLLRRLRDRDWFGSGVSGLPALSSLFESRMPSMFEGRMPALFESRMPSLFEIRMPSVDVADRAKEIIVKAEIPGIDENDLEVSVTDRTLTIKGESRHEEETEEGDMHRREIRRGSFFRTLTLPVDVDGSKAKAKCKDGMLELRLPKASGAKKHSIKLS
jgi:HSP20 family protein